MARIDRGKAQYEQPRRAWQGGQVVSRGCKTYKELTIRASRNDARRFCAQDLPGKERLHFHLSKARITRLSRMGVRRDAP